MNDIIKELEGIEKWDSYESILPKLKDIINTKEFNEFPRNRNRFYIEALSFYALSNWNNMPRHAQAYVLSRYPIFINKLAYGKTTKEYNEAKKQMFDEFNTLGLPQCPLFINQCNEFKSTIAKNQYFSFFRNSNGHVNTAMTLEQCKDMAVKNNKGLICIYLTYNLSEDLLASIVVYNQAIKTQKLVDNTVIDKAKLISNTNPKISKTEYEIIIDNEDCYICLDYGLVDLYTITDTIVPKKFIIENRVFSICPNDFILENMKILFMNDFNRKSLVTDKIQTEEKRLGDLITKVWNDDKNIFMKNIAYLKDIDYPLYLYLSWIKREDSIHNQYQAYLYTMKWIK